MGAGSSKTLLKRTLPNAVIHLEKASNLKRSVLFSIHKKRIVYRRRVNNQMARAGSPARDKAFEIYNELIGVITNRAIADQLEIFEKTVGGWKSKDKWTDKLNGTPVLIVDGKPYTWEEIGKIVMSYEGFQLMIEAVDISDELAPSFHSTRHSKHKKT